MRAVACLALLSASVVTAQTVSVPATSNIYGAGHSAPVASCDTTIGPGTTPVLVALPGQAVAVEFVDVSGSVLYCPTCGPANGPDGLVASGLALDPLAGISGIVSQTRIRFFEGVFLTDAEPVDPAPSALSFSDYSFASLSPAIAQHFYVGDGLTGTGSGNVQRFMVPPGATRLFLGFSDGFAPCVGAYSDNTGGVQATVQISACGSADFNCDGDLGTDLDIESFFQCLAGSCPAAPCASSADFNADGDLGTDADIESFFRVLAGGSC